MDTLVKAQIALIGAQEDVAKIRKDWYKVSYEKDGAKIDKALGMRPIFDNFLKSKRLTNTPVLMLGSVLKCPDDCKNRVVSAQATDTSRSSAVSSGVCEQRHATERVLSESRFELQHSGSPSKETALEEKA